MTAPGIGRYESPAPAPAKSDVCFCGNEIPEEAEVDIYDDPLSIYCSSKCARVDAMNALLARETLAVLPRVDSDKHVRAEASSSRISTVYPPLAAGDVQSRPTSSYSTALDHMSVLSGRRTLAASVDADEQIKWFDALSTIILSTPLAPIASAHLDLFLASHWRRMEALSGHMKGVEFLESDDEDGSECSSLLSLRLSQPRKLPPKKLVRPASTKVSHPPPPASTAVMTAQRLSLVQLAPINTSALDLGAVVSQVWARPESWTLHERGAGAKCPSSGRSSYRSWDAHPVRTATHSTLSQRDSAASSYSFSTTISTDSNRCDCGSADAGSAVVRGPSAAVVESAKAARVASATATASPFHFDFDETFFATLDSASYASSLRSTQSDGASPASLRATAGPDLGIPEVAFSDLTLQPLSTPAASQRTVPRAPLRSTSSMARLRQALSLSTHPHAPALPRRLGATRAAPRLPEPVASDSAERLGAQLDAIVRTRWDTPAGPLLSEVA